MLQQFSFALNETPLLRPPSNISSLLSNLLLLLLPRLLPLSAIHSLLSKHLARCHKHATSVASQAPHSLRLHSRHAQQVLQIRHVCRQLSELGVQMRELAGLGGRGGDGGQARVVRGVVGVRGRAWRASWVVGHLVGLLISNVPG